ncbi:MAG: HAMP domain-containing sensor histidine kinase [Pseudomonadota bacterium]
MHDQNLNLRGISHDINGLMARAMLAADGLREHADVGVRARACQIGAAIDRVAEICKAELDPHSQPDPTMALGSTCIERVLREIAELVAVESTLSPRPVHFYISVDEDVRLTTNPQALFRILFNLTLNAANAISRHGGSSIRLSARRSGEQILFGIGDDGPGLPQHILDYLYPSLETGKTPTEGRIGSGLITAVALASELDGELVLLSSGEAGTSFCLVLDSDPWDEISISRSASFIRADRETMA